ncbi:hypothetical protein [Streptomyces sp. NPDC093261]|uniref:hypothetical protein n=1 Tax=Streptomyces sp. NPDC093261 TaxID=3366037 RepID=UPI0038232A54
MNYAAEEALRRRFPVARRIDRPEPDPTVAPGLPRIVTVDVDGEVHGGVVTPTTVVPPPRPCLVR